MVACSAVAEDQDQDTQADSPVEDTLRAQVVVDPNVVVVGRDNQVEVDSLGEDVPNMEEALQTCLVDASVDSQVVVHQEILVVAVYLVLPVAGLLVLEHLERQKVLAA